MHRTWHHCCSSSPPRLIFGTRVDHCDDFGHKRGFHLVALWAFKIGGNQWRQNLSLSQWGASLLAIGSVSNLTRHCSCWCSMHKTMWVYTSFYTIWKRIESFNECYLIFYQMLLLLLSEVNNTTIFLMASLNAINRKNRWLLYTAPLLSLLLAIDKRPTPLVVMAWSHQHDLASCFFSSAVVEDKTLDGTGTMLASISLASAFPSNGMLLLFHVIDNSFNKLINQLQLNLFVVCGRHS